MLPGLPRRPPLRPRKAPGAEGRLCPYREHALISQQEHEAWDVLHACQGQLRFAPRGHVHLLFRILARPVEVIRGAIRLRSAGRAQSRRR
jgi:hypothetical protein